MSPIAELEVRESLSDNSFKTINDSGFNFVKCLCILWPNIHKWRFWVQLEFGYDPHFRNVDQTPLHKNESGSKVYKTISFKNAYSVPLLENHAAARERISVSSVTDSNEHRIRHERLPGFEVMFKAEGHKKQADLQKYADGLGCPCLLYTSPEPTRPY